jgi:hypothetical protein
VANLPAWNMHYPALKKVDVVIHHLVGGLGDKYKAIVGTIALLL